MKRDQPSSKLIAGQQAEKKRKPNEELQEPQKLTNNQKYQKAIKTFFIKNKQKINDNLVRLCIENGQKFFINSLTIRENIKKEVYRLQIIKVLNSLKENGQEDNYVIGSENKNEFIKQIIRIYEVIQSQSILSLRVKFDRFISRGENIRFKLIFKIFYEIKQMIKKQNQQITYGELQQINKQLKNEKILIESEQNKNKKHFTKQTEEIVIKLSDEEWLKMSQEIDHRIFQLQKVNGSTVVKLLFPIRIIYLIFASTMEDRFQELNQLQFIQLLSNSALDSYMEGLIIKILSIPKTQWKYSQNISIKISNQVCTFQPIPANRNNSLKKDNYHFMSKNRYLTQIIKNPNQSFVFLPYFDSEIKLSIKKSPQKNKINWRSQNSKSIDFIISKKSQDNNEIQFFCFDVSGKSQDIEKKLKSFINVYENSFKNRNDPFIQIKNINYRLKVKYLVLIPSITFIEQEMKKPNFQSQQLQFEQKENLKWSVESKNGFQELLTQIGVQLFQTDSITNKNHQIFKYLNAFSIIQNQNL